MQITQGPLTRISLPEILRQCKLQQSTGTLILNRAGIEKKLYFKQGKLVYIASNKSGERLAEFLVHSGDLTKSWAAFLLKDSQRNGIGFTTSLLKKKILNEKHLGRSVSHLAAKAVADAISWTSGSFEFGPELPQQVSRGPIKITEEDVISAALHNGEEQRSADEDLIRTIAQKIVACSFYMPLLPAVVAKLEELWRTPESAEILQIARTDQALTVHVLRVLNAGDHSLQNPCSSLKEAEGRYPGAHLSGIIRAKAVTATRPHQPDTVALLQQQALGCALLAEQIATELGEDAQLAYTCALLHNVGKVALLQLLGDERLQSGNLHAQINKLHQNTGALLARRGNLHSAVYATIRHYNKPDAAEENINFGQLQIDSLLANLPLIDELSAAAFSS
ncbi:MAG: HDOD domain-containing protein [Geobacteraceae bacterium]|nr:HDOD domain-containing protein [Geobacteraceae bacterium]